MKHSTTKGKAAFLRVCIYHTDNFLNNRYINPGIGDSGDRLWNTI